MRPLPNSRPPRVNLCASLWTVSIVDLSRSRARFGHALNSPGSARHPTRGGDLDLDIRVVPIEKDVLASLMEGDDAFAAATGMKVANGYLAFPEALDFTAERLNLGMDPVWSTHLVVDTAENELVGMGGFNGPPELDSVELGLSIAPARQGEGIGAAAVGALVARAAERGARMVYAFTLAEPGPSPSMLIRCGFRKVAEIPESEDGPLWRWEVSC